MNIEIVTCFQPYEERVDRIKQYFLSKGLMVKVLSTNYKHISKEFRDDSKPYYSYIDTKPYSKNFSLARIISHIHFAKKAVESLVNDKPDAIYVVLPPNFLAYEIVRRIDELGKVKIFFDVMDLWPETMPLGWFKYTPIYYIWEKLRDNYLKHAEFIITECDLFKETLQKSNPDLCYKTLYLSKENDPYNVMFCPEQDDTLNICYLGSINNVIDIDIICNVLSGLSKHKKTILHIIGDGENLSNLIEGSKNSGAEVVFHGKIYSQDKKQKIFNMCNFGLNIMKKEVCVGLTMKSIDYFQSGLPIINNIRHDTKTFVNIYNNGFNINETNLDEIIQKILKQNIIENKAMRKKSLELFNDKFSPNAFEKRLDEYFRDFTN